MKLKSIKIPEDLHRRVRIHVAKTGIKLKDFIEAAILEKLRRERK